MADLVFNPELIERLRRENLRVDARELLSRSFAFAASRSHLARSLAQSIDDRRQLELEQLLGPEDERSPLIRHTNRRLSETERVLEVKESVAAVIAMIRSSSELEEQD